MIILGIDPGIRADNPAGWALFREAEGDIAAGVIVPPRGCPWEERIVVVSREVVALLRRHGADALACEDAFLGKSAQVFRQLVAFGWEMRVQARLEQVAFALVPPGVQAMLLNPKSRRALPAPLLEAATGHLSRTHRPHAQSAMAIAWHGAGLVALDRRRALARLTT